MARYKTGGSFDHERLRNLVGEGMTLPQIAEAMGVTHRTISRHKRTLGLSRPKPQPVLPDGWEQVAQQLFDEGYSQRAVSEVTGVSEHTIGRTFPGRAWSYHQAGKYAVEVRRLNRLQHFAQSDRRHRHEQEHR